MRCTCHLLLLLALLPSCATSIRAPREPVVAQPLDHAAVLKRARGAGTRVIVVGSDPDDDDVLVAYLQVWRRAGSGHVMPADFARPASLVGLLRLAHVVEFAGDGPHSLAGHADVQTALATARARGLIVLGAPVPPLR